MIKRHTYGRAGSHLLLDRTLLSSGHAVVTTASCHRAII